MREDRSRPLVNFVSGFFDVLACTVAVLKEPKNALFAICIWFAIELVFPTLPVLHEILLFSYALCIVPLAYFVKKGAARLKAENEALRRVPYLGNLLFLKSRTGDETRGIRAWQVAIIVSLLVSFLNLVSLLVNAAKLMAAF